MTDDLLTESLKYFKGDDGFKRAFIGMRSKFLSLGAVGGTVTINNLNDGERRALSGLLRRNLTGADTVTFRLSEFQIALDRTKFKGIGLEDLLEAYFREELVPYSQAERIFVENRNRFFKEFMRKYEGSPAGDWIEHSIKERQYGYSTLIRRYSSDPANLSKDLHHVCKALNTLPNSDEEKVSLAVFGAEIASDPHIFDEGAPCRQLFTAGLMYLFGADKPANAAERADLLYRAGILIDELSNMVTSFGITAYLSDDKIHGGWEGFQRNMEPVQSTLLNISVIKRVSVPGKKVFVVENPSVFAALLSGVKETGMPHLPFVCTSGQVNMAGLALLDLIAASGAEMFYSGDYDPEGLMIAQRLKNRLGDRLRFWRYTPGDYLLSKPSKAASESRLKQLDNIISVELLPLVDAMRKTALCGYQESIIELLIRDMLG